MLKLAMQPQGGNFGQAVGTDSGALQEAMQRRGLGGGATSVVSPAAPTSTNNPLPAPLPQGGSAVPQGAPQASQGGIGLPPNSGESSIIVKALDARLKGLTKLQEMGIQV